MQPDPKKYKVKTIDMCWKRFWLYMKTKKAIMLEINPVSQFVQIKLAGFFTLILNGQSLI